MTYASCLNSAEWLLQSNVPGLVSVGQIETMPPMLDVTQCPGVVLLETHPRTKALSGGADGYVYRDWSIECHLFAFYPDMSNADSFRDLIEGIENTFLHNLSLGGTANTANTQVLSLGLDLETIFDPWEEDNGLIKRHAIVRVPVHEIIGR